MKYTSDQLKDIILLSKKGCIGRKCSKGCMWNEADICSLLLSQFSSSELISNERVRKAARKIILELIEGIQET